MTDLLTSGVTWLNGVRKASASRSVAYTRPGETPVTLSATPGQRFSQTDGEDVPISADERDWIIEAADLAIDSTLTKPQRGDTITDGDQVFEVMAINGEKCWRPSDPMGIAIRIHSKRRGES